MKRAKQLLEQIAEPENLREAFLRAARGKGGKREVVEFRRDLDTELAALRNGILEGSLELGRFLLWGAGRARNALSAAAVGSTTPATVVRPIASGFTPGYCGDYLGFRLVLSVNR